MSENQRDIVRIEPKASIKIDTIKPLDYTDFDELVANVITGRWKLMPGFTYEPNGDISFGEIMVYKEVVESGS